MEEHMQRNASMSGEPLDLAGTFAEAKARAVERFEATYLEGFCAAAGGT